MNIFSQNNSFGNLFFDEFGTVIVEREREREREYSLNIPFIKTRTYARNIIIFFQINQRNCLIFLGRFFVFFKRGNPAYCVLQSKVFLY
jgi:hypothetical protein